MVWSVTATVCAVAILQFANFPENIEQSFVRARLIMTLYTD